jgi:hypothetical protein
MLLIYIHDLSNKFTINIFLLASKDNGSFTPYFHFKRRRNRFTLGNNNHLKTCQQSQKYKLKKSTSITKNQPKTATPHSKHEIDQNAKAIANHKQHNQQHNFMHQIKHIQRQQGYKHVNKKIENHWKPC